MGTALGVVGQLTSVHWALSHGVPLPLDVLGKQAGRDLLVDRCVQRHVEGIGHHEVGRTDPRLELSHSAGKVVGLDGIEREVAVGGRLRVQGGLRVGPPIALGPDEPQGRR